jgi:hypothetical protein
MYVILTLEGRTQYDQPRKGKSAMPYGIAFRSRTDAKTLGWYDGSNYRWSTDFTRQVLFKKQPDAKFDMR